jgi:PCFT/HCP family folate transporter-like MFS transporter 1/3
MTFILLMYMGSMQVMFPFVERVYYWDIKHYSNVSAIGSVVKTLVMVIGIVVLTKWVKVSDVQLGLIGTVAGFAGGLCQASILNPWGLYLSYGMGAMTGAAPIAIRSYLSKIVGKDEITKAFSLMSTLESLAPFCGTLFFTNIFNATIEHYPSMAFHASTTALFIPLLVLIWIDTCCDPVP